MKTKFIYFIFCTFTCFFTIFTLNINAQSRDVPFTLEDRNRIMQTQAEIASLRTEMNARFESMNESINTRFESQQQQMDDLKASIQDLRNLFYWAFGLMIALMTLIFGFIIWDRRTAMEPMRERSQTLIQSLREYAKKQPDLAEILRSHGLM